MVVWAPAPLERRWLVCTVSHVLILFILTPSHSWGRSWVRRSLTLPWTVSWISMNRSLKLHSLWDSIFHLSTSITSKEIMVVSPFSFSMWHVLLKQISGYLINLFVFLFLFDLHSVGMGKDPWAMVRSLSHVVRQEPPPVLRAEACAGGGAADLGP